MSSRYQVGGALRPGALYVPRAADAEAEAAMLAGDAIHVLGPRQLGKSSLRLRLAGRLEAAGVRVAHLDLSGLGAPRDTAAWIAAVADELASELGDDALARVASEVGATRSLARLLEAASAGGPWALFVDEVDALVSWPEAADAFLGALRAAWDAQGGAERPLRLCLSGVVAPFELGADPNRTPFNVSRPIALVDFSRGEIASFGADFHLSEREALLDALYDWTAGHPYMSHRLAERLAAGEGEGEPAARVAGLVARLFVDGGVHGDANLAGAARRLAAAGDDAAEMLALYRRALVEGGIEADGRRAAVARLLLTGLVAWRATPEGPRLQVRNRVYAAVFDRGWVDEQLDRRPFTAALEGWARAGRGGDWLLRGAALEAAERWAQGRADLNQDEVAFLLRSSESWRAEREARAELERLKLAEALAVEQRQRQRQRVRALAAVAAVALVAVLVLVGATLRLSAANAAMLLDRARVALRTPDLATAEVAAAASLTLADTPGARGALIAARVGSRPRLAWQVPVAGGFTTGRLLASAGRVIAPDGHDLVLRDAATGAEVARVAAAADDARAVAGSRLYARAAFGPIQELDLARGEVLRTIADAPLRPDETIEDLALSADGASMFMNTSAHRLSRWDLQTGQAAWVVDSPGPARCKLAAGSAGLVVGCSNGALAWIDPHSGVILRQEALRGAAAPIWAGQALFVAGDRDGRGVELLRWPEGGQPTEVSSAAILPWGALDSMARGAASTRSLATQGGTLWTSLRDGTALAIDAALAAPVSRFRVGDGGLWLVADDERLFTLADDGLLRGWFAPAAGARAPQPPLDGVGAGAFWADEAGVVLATARGQVEARGSVDGAPLASWTAPTHGAISRVVRTPLALWIGTDQGEVLRHDGAWSARLPADGTGVMALAASQDGRVVAALRRAAPLWVWRDGAARSLPCGGRAETLALSPDGRWLAAACNGLTPETLHQLRVWDLARPEVEHTLTLTAASPSTLAWAPDGGALWVGLDEGEIRRWTASGGLQPWGGRVGGPVSDLAVSPDGRRLALCDPSGSVQIWSERGAPLAVVTGLPRAPVRLALDAERLTVRFADGALQVWSLDALDADPDALYAEASARWGLAIDGGALVSRPPGG